MKYLKIFLLAMISLAASNSFGQDMAFDYQYSITDKEHYVINIPKDSTYHQWGIWKSAAQTENEIHTMKMFMKKSEVLYLKYFQGVAEIVLENNETIPIDVYWSEEDDAPVKNYEKVLAFHFSQTESDILLKQQIKKILFYTTYGKFTVVFADKEMVQKALFTLKYNVNIFDEVNRELVSTMKLVEE